MENRSVQLTIQLNNVKTVAELEQNIKDINIALKQTEVNSQAFAELTDLAKKADVQMKNIKDDIKGFSDEKQLDSVAKIGGSIAAGFSIATIASQAFGQKNQEQIQKAIQTATQLTAVITSIKPLMEGLSSTNRAAFLQYVNGFKSSAIGATLFGNATRAAITSTGIGAFVILLVAIATNWDKISDAIGLAGTAQQKYIAQQQLIIDQQKAHATEYSEQLSFEIQLLEAEGASLDKILDKKKEQVNLNLQIAKLEQSLAKERLEAYIAEFSASVQNVDINGTVLTMTQEEINATVKKQAEYIELKKKFDDIRASVTQYAQTLLLLNTQEAKFDNDQAKKVQDEKAAFDAKARAYVEDADAKIKAQEDVDLAAIKSIEAKKDADDKETENYFKNKAKEREAAQAQLQATIDLNLLNYHNETQTEDQKKKDRDARFKDTIAQISQYSQLGLDAINKVSQAITQQLSQNLASTQKQIDLANSAYQESTANVLQLTSELSQVQGSAHDAVLAQLDEEKAKQAQAAKDRAKLQALAVKYQNQQNQVQWETALLDSIVQGALAVVKALPAIPLSIATGILAGAETAVIASHPPKPIPVPSGFYTGGYTPSDSSNRTVVGSVHANEYVVPADVLSTNTGSQLVATLEAMRKGYADGGFTSAPSISENQFQALTGSDLLSAIATMKIYTSIVEVKEGLNKVQLIQDNNSF